MGLDGLHETQGHPDEDGEEVQVGGEGVVEDWTTEGAGWTEGRSGCERVNEGKEVASARVKRDAMHKPGRHKSLPPRMRTSAG